jgi:hypothetical protein
MIIIFERNIPASLTESVIIGQTVNSAKRSLRASRDCADRTLTIVSGYINIGSFQKGVFDNYIFKTDNYTQWIAAFAFIENPVIFYTDDVKIAKLVRQHRAGYKTICTRIHLINRTKLWGFRLLPSISLVLAQSGYPKFYPNTVVPEYAAVTHSKFDMLEMALTANPFDTAYFAWMDCGLFRETLTTPVHLSLPPGFDENKVAGNQVRPYTNFSQPLRDIFFSDTQCKQHSTVNKVCSIVTFYIV